MAFSPLSCEVLLEKDDICIDPALLEWARIAVFKKAYRIYRERGYRPRWLSAAFRNHMHGSEFIAGAVVISSPYSWQLRYNASDIRPVPRMDHPVDPRIVAALTDKFADLGRAYAEDGIAVDDFDSFGATRRTLRQFLAAGAEWNAVIRDLTVPNPDKN